MKTVLMCQIKSLNKRINIVTIHSTANLTLARFLLYFNSNLTYMVEWFGFMYLIGV